MAHKMGHYAKHLWNLYTTLPRLKWKKHYNRLNYHLKLACHSPILPTCNGVGGMMLTSGSESTRKFLQKVLTKIVKLWRQALWSRGSVAITPRSAPFPRIHRVWCKMIWYDMKRPLFHRFQIITILCWIKGIGWNISGMTLK